MIIEIFDESDKEQEKEISQKSLIRELKALSLLDKKKKEDEVVDTSNLVLSNISNKKKKKKNEKKKKEVAKTPDDIQDSDDVLYKSIMDRDMGIVDDDFSLNFIDLEDEELEEYDLESDIIGLQCGNYKKLKKEENEYKKEFAEELTLLYNLLDETNKYVKKLEVKYDSLESSKARGISKYTSDIAASVLQGKQSKLQIIKEIANIKKTISDLKLKADSKNKSNNGGEMNTELLASTYLQNILKTGRTSFIDTITGNGDTGDVNLPNLENHEIADLGYDVNAYDAYEDTIEQRLDNETNRYRDSEEGDTYIKYENRGVKIQIQRDIDSGDWEFIAIDKDNQRVYDFPLPDRTKLGKIKFSSDGEYASDKYGRSYKVIELI